MPRIYDSSYLTQRKAEQAAAKSFYTPANGSTVPWGSRPLLGIKDSSIMYAIKNGAMTEYTRFDTCIGISPGCPCQALAVSLTTSTPLLPGFVSGIVFTVGSVIVSWQAPTAGNGPFTYTVTPYLNGQALPSVTTAELTYRFTTLDEMKQYTFTVCAMNTAGAGPVLQSGLFMSPPAILSNILLGTAPMVDIDTCLCYLMNNGLDVLLQYLASLGVGPTIASRIVYLWTTSVVHAWNWITTDARVSGVIDNLNWASTNPLNVCDSIVWMAKIIDYVTPFIVPTYTSIYTYNPVNAERVQSAGNWTAWQSTWSTWYTYRQSDGAAAAITAMPTTSANWNNTIVVDGANNIPGFPDPLQWTRLTVQGKMQKYLTYNWSSVLTSCLSEQNEQDIVNSIAPLTGSARDAEVDQVLQMSAQLTDTQKAQAEFWAGSGAGTISPPLMGIWMLKEYIRCINARCPDMMYSLLDMAVHMFEGARVTWRIKTQYMQARPIQEIRRRYTGQQVQSWNGAIDGAQWTPYQAANFVTPPFADFNSGHSHFTKLFALTMNKWFGSSIVKNTITYDNLSLFSSLFAQTQTIAFGDFVVPVGTSSVQPNVAPSAPVTFSFATWNDMADSSGMSRLYGGIHCLSAHTTSQTTAIEVDAFVNSAWNIRSITAQSQFIGQSYVIDAEPDLNAQSIMDWIDTHPNVPIEAPVQAAAVPVEVPVPVPVPVEVPVELVPVPVEAPVEPVPVPVEAPVEPVPEPVSVPVEVPVEPVPEPVSVPVEVPVEPVPVPVEAPVEAQ